MPRSEIIAAVAAILSNLWFYKKYIKKGQISLCESCILFLGIAPVAFLSVQMVSDTITADETQYMRAIIAMENLLKDPVVAEKLMLQYRLSQMLFGTLFMLLPRAVVSYMPQTILLVLYKFLHWLFFFLMGEIMACIVCRKYLVQTVQAWKQMLAWVLVSGLVLGLPMSISVMKVCNYDASNVIFGSLGILLVGIEVMDAMHGKEIGYSIAGWLGMFCCVLGCLDKWSCGIYFIICAVLFCFAKVICFHGTVYGKIKNALVYAASIMVSALLFGYLNLEYIHVVLAKGQIYEKIGFGHIAFSFVNLLTILLEESGGAARVTPYAGLYILLLALAIAAAALLLALLYAYISRKIPRGGVQRKAFGRLMLVVPALMVCGGIYSTYFIPQMMEPYERLKDGERFADVIWGVYHYGAFTLLGHKAAQILYAFATVVCNLPSATLLLFAVFIIVLWKEQEMELFYPVVICGCVAVVAILACMNQPSDARYFGVPIYLMSLGTFSVFFNRMLAPCGESKKNISLIFAGILGGAVLSLAELAAYMPNVKIFAPVWYCHSKEWKQTVRLGHWDAGEAMSWGEELALAGRKIKGLAEESGMEPGEITIYSNYGQIWLKNPGFTIRSVSDQNLDMRFDDTTYVVLTKKRLFRTMELPDFLDKVEPVDVVAYRGEICSWIYKGSQLIDFKDYFGIQDDGLLNKERK